jgi:hypothetical protein
VFNEKADKLQTSRFTSDILSHSTRFRIEASNEGGKAWREGPNSEAIDAFVVTIRFFVDDKVVSFRSMARRYTELGEAGLLTEELVSDFNRVRNNANKFLDQNSPLTYNEGRYTRRQVFEALMWGEVAHANQAQKALVDEWRRSPIIAFMENEFVGTFANLLLVIFHMRDSYTCQPSGATVLHNGSGQSQG